MTRVFSRHHLTTVYLANFQPVTVSLGGAWAGEDHTFFNVHRHVTLTL